MLLDDDFFDLAFSVDNGIDLMGSRLVSSYCIAKRTMRINPAASPLAKGYH